MLINKPFEGLAWTPHPQRVYKSLLIIVSNRYLYIANIQIIQLRNTFNQNNYCIFVLTVIETHIAHQSIHNQTPNASIYMRTFRGLFLIQNKFVYKKRTFIHFVFALV